MVPALLFNLGFVIQVWSIFICSPDAAPSSESTNLKFHELSEQLNHLSLFFFDRNNLICEKNYENSGFIVLDLVVASLDAVNNIIVLILTWDL